MGVTVFIVKWQLLPQESFSNWNMHRWGKFISLLHTEQVAKGDGIVGLVHFQTLSIKSIYPARFGRLHQQNHRYFFQGETWAY